MTRLEAAVRSAPPATSATTNGAPSNGAPTLFARVRFWVVLLAVLVAVAIGASAVLGARPGTGPALGASTTGPDGAQALVQVLRHQGVKVVTTSTLGETRKATGADPEHTTVFVYDAGSYLIGSQWKDLVDLSAHTIVAEPDPATLDAIAPSVTAEGANEDKTGVAARCDLAAFARAATVTPTGSSYSTSDSTATRCLPGAGGRGFGLLQATKSGRTTTILGATSALTNGVIESDDNAAFALALLGDSPTLVWYLPGVGDLSPGHGTLASLTPPWVTPSIALLAVAALAAAIWRGRRFGPLVVENLPVVVRSTETMEGRARLYARGSSRVHALDQLRIGTIARLASITGLPRSASVDEVTARVADLVGADPRAIRSVLVDIEPRDDRHLVALSDSLTDLERAASVAARGPATASPSGDSPHEH